MIDWFKKVFKKKKKEEKHIDIRNIELGTHLRLYIKDPRTIGIINADMSLRYDPDDIQKKQITGTLTNRKNVRDIIFLELGTYKFINGERRERLYTLMSEEIDKVEIL